MKRFAETSAALLVSLTFPVFASAQAPAADEKAAPKRPMIKLSGTSEAEAAKPDAQPAPPEAKEEEPSEVRVSDQKSPDAPTEDVKPEEKEPFDGEVLPMTPESQVGKQPAPGLGPAETAPSKDPTDEQSDLSRPRVIQRKEKPQIDGGEPEPPPEPDIPANQLPFTYHLKHLDAALGFRVVGTVNDGLDPFMAEPVLVETYFRLGGALGLTDRIALAAHGEFGGATTSASIRDLPSELGKVHATVGVEGRYHFIHWMYAYGRAAPGIEIVNANVDSGGELLENPEKLGSPAFQVDGAVGAAFRFAGASDGRKRSARGWAYVEGGYRFSGEHELELSVADGGPSRAVPLALEPLNLSGGFFSSGVMLTF